MARHSSGENPRTGPDPDAFVPPIRSLGFQVFSLSEIQEFDDKRIFGEPEASRSTAHAWNDGNRTRERLYCIVFFPRKGDTPGSLAEAAGWMDLPDDLLFGVATVFPGEKVATHVTAEAACLAAVRAFVNCPSNKRADYGYALGLLACFSGGLDFDTYNGLLTLQPGNWNLTRRSGYLVDFPLGRVYRDVGNALFAYTPNLFLAAYGSWGLNIASVQYGQAGFRVTSRRDQAFTNLVSGRVCRRFKVSLENLDGCLPIPSNTLVGVVTKENNPASYTKHLEHFDNFPEWKDSPNPQRAALFTNAENLYSSCNETEPNRGGFVYTAPTPATLPRTPPNTDSQGERTSLTQHFPLTKPSALAPSGTPRKSASASSTPTYPVPTALQGDFPEGLDELGQRLRVVGAIDPGDAPDASQQTAASEPSPLIQGATDLLRGFREVSCHRNVTAIYTDFTTVWESLTTERKGLEEHRDLLKAERDATLLSVRQVYDSSVERVNSHMRNLDSVVSGLANFLHHVGKLVISFEASHDAANDSGNASTIGVMDESRTSVEGDSPPSEGAAASRQLPCNETAADHMATADDPGIGEQQVPTVGAGDDLEEEDSDDPELVDWDGTEEPNYSEPEPDEPDELPEQPPAKKPRLSSAATDNSSRSATPTSKVPGAKGELEFSPKRIQKLRATGLHVELPIPNKGKAPSTSATSTGRGTPDNSGVIVLVDADNGDGTPSRRTRSKTSQREQAKDVKEKRRKPPGARPGLPLDSPRFRPLERVGGGLSLAVATERNTRPLQHPVKITYDPDVGDHPLTRFCAFNDQTNLYEFKRELRDGSPWPHSSLARFLFNVHGGIPVMGSPYWTDYVETPELIKRYEVIKSFTNARRYYGRDECSTAPTGDKERIREILRSKLSRPQKMVELSYVGTLRRNMPKFHNMSGLYPFDLGPICALNLRASYPDDIPDCFFHERGEAHACDSLDVRAIRGNPNLLCADSLFHKLGTLHYIADKKKLLNDRIIFLVDTTDGKWETPLTDDAFRKRCDKACKYICTPYDQLLKGVLRVKLHYDTTAEVKNQSEKSRSSYSFSEGSVSVKTEANGFRYYRPRTIFLVSGSDPDRNLGLVMRIHDPEALTRFRNRVFCPWCRWVSSNQQTLATHVQVAHYRALFYCKDCGYGPFHSLDSLGNHWPEKPDGKAKPKGESSKVTSVRCKGAAEAERLYRPGAKIYDRYMKTFPREEPTKVKQHADAAFIEMWHPSMRIKEAGSDSLDDSDKPLEPEEITPLEVTRSDIEACMND